MYSYQKARPQTRNKRSWRKRPGLSWFLSLLPFILVSIGLGFIASVFWPMLSWRINYLPQTTPEIIKPIPEAVAREARTGGELTRASSWFPLAPPQKPSASRISSYTLSVPKLKIFDATTIIGGEDLEKNLIHYGGTALPGEYGKVVIFGHSVLPQFFNPKSYKAIFSTIHTLRPGDEIFLTFDGIEYKYKVFSLEVVDPANISVLEQKYDDFYLALVTCTPPGTYWKRLIVNARIEKPQ